MNQHLKELEINFKTILEKLCYSYEDISNQNKNISTQKEELNKQEIEIFKKESEIEDFKKVSIMSAMSKQIKERDKKIARLEKQLNKYKQKVSEFTKKTNEKSKMDEKSKKINIQNDWEKLSKEIYNLENTIFDTYNESKSIIPIELLAKGYQIYKDERNHNNRFWIKTDSVPIEKSNDNKKKSLKETGKKTEKGKETETGKETEKESNENNLLSLDEVIISSEDEEEEVLYEDVLDGKTYFISESNPKLIYEKLDNDEVGENIGFIDKKGKTNWNLNK
jgi:hypothetical protein